MICAWSRWLGWTRDPDHARRVAILSETPMFAGLPKRFVGHLAAMLFEKAYAPGDVIFFEGDPGEALYIVLDGNVEILLRAPHGEQCVASCGPCTAFGELALINDLPRLATARATVPTHLLILYHTDFENLVEGDRRIAVVVMQNLLRTFAGYVHMARTATAARTETAVAAVPISGSGSAGSGVSPSGT